jgi:hypothetical protein
MHNFLSVLLLEHLRYKNTIEKTNFVIKGSSNPKSSHRRHDLRGVCSVATGIKVKSAAVEKDRLGEHLHLSIYNFSTSLT